MYGDVPCMCAQTVSGAAPRRQTFYYTAELPRVRSFVLTLFIFKKPNYMLVRTLTERVV